MKRKKREITRKTRKQNSANNLWTKILLVALLFFCLFLIDKIISIQLRPVNETAKSSQARIPVDVKKSLTSVETTYRVPILLYHYVEYVQDKKDLTRESLNIQPFAFEQQVKTLKENGYTFMTAKELGEVLDGHRKMPKKPVLLTFDDGHWDLETTILPILEKYNAKATAYIITSFIGDSDFLTKDQLNTVIKSGLVEIGAHTVHHVSLKGKLSFVVNYEVNQSKKDLEQNYHLKVVSFAYPDGAFDEQAISSVKSAGFTTAVSTIPGILQSQQNGFFLFRIRPGYKAGQELLDYLNQDKFKKW